MKNRIVSLRLTDSELAGLCQGFDDIVMEDDFDPRHSVQAAQVVKRCLEPDHLNRVRSIMSESHDAPILAVIENAPIGNDLGDGPLPQDGCRPPWLKSRYHELFGSGLAAALDLIIYTVLEEYYGKLNHYLSPVAAFANVPTGRSPKRLGDHSDNVVLGTFNPSFILLAGLRRDVPTLTSFLDLDALVASIDPEHQAVLEQPLFRLACPTSFLADNSAPLFSPPVALLQRDRHGRLISYFNEFSSRPAPGTGAAPAAAIAALVDAACRPEHRIGIDLAPGTTVLASNRRSLHSRGDIQGSRMILRQYFTDDLAPFFEVGAAVPGMPNVFYAPTLIISAYQKALSRTNH